MQRIGTLALYSAVAAAADLLFVDTVFGALTGHAGWLFLALWGYTLLNPFFSALNPIFPHGGGLSIIRGIQYFDGRGISAGVLCLTIWGTVGTTLLAVAAARGKRAADTATPRRRRPGLLGAAVPVLSD